MYDIVEGIHKALRIDSTWAFVLVIAFGSACVGGFFAWIIDTGYKNSPEYKADYSPKSEAVADKGVQAPPATAQQPQLSKQSKVRPTEEAVDIAHMPTKMLCTNARIVVSEIRALHDKYDRQLKDADNNLRRRLQMIPEGDPKNNIMRDEFTKAHTMEIQSIMGEEVEEFHKRFWSLAVLYKNTLLTRYTTVPERAEHADSAWVFPPNNDFGVSDIADDLEMLAIGLQKQH